MTDYWTPSRFIPAESFGVNIVRNTPDGEMHAQRHMEICRAMDMTGLSVVLGKMVASRQISRLQADAFHAQASGLLASMLAENHRSFIGSSAQSTIETIRRFGIAAAEGASAQ